MLRFLCFFAFMFFIGWAAVAAAPCEGGVTDTEELRCRLAIVERELHAAHSNAMILEGKLRMTEAQLRVTEEKAKWLVGVVWPPRHP